MSFANSALCLDVIGNFCSLFFQIAQTTVLISLLVISHLKTGEKLVGTLTRDVYHSVLGDNDKDHSDHSVFSTGCVKNVN